MRNKIIHLSTKAINNTKALILGGLLSIGTMHTTMAQTVSYGDFPFEEMFTTTVQPEGVLKPTGSGANDATFTTNGLQLTRASNNLFGSVYINNKEFHSQYGIKISFEYSIYGGTGADGISVFLFDAAANPVVSGSTGGGMAYTYNRANNSYPSNRKSGLTGGYLGIFLDTYGNSKDRRFQPESRVNGALLSSVWSNNGSHVVLRGAEGRSVSGLTDGYTGYPVLITKSTLSVSSAVSGGAILNDTGTGYDAIGGVSTPFNLRSGAFTTDPSNTAFRQAYISLIPHPDGGFNVTVQIQNGSKLTTVIENYHYKAMEFFPYVENAMASGGDLNTSNIIATAVNATLDSRVPEKFKIGFGAATGGLNDIHLIRNLKIELPNAAQAGQDTGEMCQSTGTLNIDALANDSAFSGPTNNPSSSNTNVDPASFRFHDGNWAFTPDPYNYTNASGQWTYSPTTRLVTYTANPSFVGDAIVAYTIKGTSSPTMPTENYGDEGYRSMPATISINVISCCNIGTTTPVIN